MSCLYCGISTPNDEAFCPTCIAYGEFMADCPPSKPLARKELDLELEELEELERNYKQHNVSGDKS